MYQKILIPLDGSQRAEAIFPHVESLARRMDSALILLQVVDPVVGAAGMDGLSPIVVSELVDREAEAAGTYLEHKRSDLAGLGIAVKTVMRYGAVVPTIIEVAAEEEVDLIALASHGRSGLARLFYGSVAAGILQRADRPLLIIRAADQP